MDQTKVSDARTFEIVSWMRKVVGILLNSCVIDDLIEM